MFSYRGRRRSSCGSKRGAEEPVVTCGEHRCGPLTAVGAEQHRIGAQRTAAPIRASSRKCTKPYSFYLGEAHFTEDGDEWFDHKPLVQTPSLANASRSLHCTPPLQASTQTISLSATIT